MTFRNVAVTFLVVWVALASRPAAALSPAEILAQYDTGQVQEAISNAWELVRATRQAPGPTSLAACEAVELLYDVLPSLLDAPTDSLEQWLAEAQASRAALFGEMDPRCLPAIWRRCGLLRRQNQNEKVEPLLVQGQAIVAQAPAVPLRSRLEMLVAAADLAYARRDVDTAAPLFADALALADQLEQPPGDQVARLSLRLSRALDRQGQVAAALAKIETALAIYEDRFGAGSIHLTSALTTRATQLNKVGRLTEAVLDNERAVAIYRQSLGGQHPHVAGILNNLGNQLTTVGDFRGAEGAIAESIQIREANYGAEDPSLAQSYLNLGRAFARQGKSAAAIAAYERSLALLGGAPRPNQRLQVKVLGNLGAVYNALGRFAPAQAVLNEAIALEEEQSGPLSIDLVIPLVNLSVTRRFQGRLPEALALAERSMAIQQAVYADESADLIDGFENLAGIHYQLGQFDLALQAAVQAERNSRRDLQRTADGFAESTAEAAANVRSSNAPTLLRIALAWPDQPPETLAFVTEQAFRSRGLTFEHALGRRRRLAARIGFAETEARRELHLSELREALPSGSVLVSYWYAPPARSYDDTTGRYFAIVTARDRLDLLDLGAAPAIDREVALWRQAVEKAPVDDDAQSLAIVRRRGERVRQRIWDPLAPLVAEAQLVLIVPDNQLHFIPFAALPRPDGSYLVEHEPTLHYLSSEKDLLPALGLDPPSRSGLLVLGGIDFDADLALAPAVFAPQPANLRSIAECASFSELHFTPLPASLGEARSIATLWGQAIGGTPLLLSGDTAREEIVCRQASLSSTLHFATHGFFLGGECGETAPQSRGVGGLAPAGPGSGPVAESFRLSGLALAGANARATHGSGPTDGILTAEEIAGLDLRGVEWVVLSACDTGLGDLVQAEGVYGLRRSFRLAGASTVISSLWAVDDQATEDWMLELYRARLQQRVNSAQAVREASLRVLESRRKRGTGTHPFYWASFTGSGRWE